MIMFFTCVCLSVNRITQKLLKLKCTAFILLCCVFDWILSVVGSVLWKCTAFMKFYGVTGLDTIQ